MLITGAGKGGGWGGGGRERERRGKGAGQDPGISNRGVLRAEPHSHVGVVEVLYCNILCTVQPRTTGSQVKAKKNTPGFESQIYFDSQGGGSRGQGP